MNIPRWRIVYLVVFLFSLSLSFLGNMLEMMFLNFIAVAILVVILIWIIANRKKTQVKTRPILTGTRFFLLHKITTIYLTKLIANRIHKCRNGIRALNVSKLAHDIRSNLSIF